MITSGSIGKIAPALLAAQKAMSNPSKQSRNPFYNSAYADLNSVREACMPALHDNGISVLQIVVQVSGDKERMEKLDLKKQEQTVQESTENYVETILLHETGEYIGSRTKIVCSRMADPQAYGSAVSYARRYGLQAIVALGADDDDGERAMGRVKKQEAKQEAQEAKDFHSFDNKGDIKETSEVEIMAPEEREKFSKFVYENWAKLEPALQAKLVTTYGNMKDITTKTDARAIMVLMKGKQKTEGIDIKAKRNEQNR